MNLNENPRLENIEISEDSNLAEFFESIVSGVFNEVDPNENKSPLPKLDGISESFPFAEIQARTIKRERLNEPRTTHTVRRSH